MMRRLNLLASIRGLPRDLQLLFWSFFLWTFGLGLYNYVWPLFLEQLHASPSQVGLVFSIGFIAIAVTLIPGGILANRYELRTLLIIGWIMSIPVPLMYYFARIWTDVIPGIILLQASGFNIPAFNAYIVGAGEKAKIASNFGIIWQPRHWALYSRLQSEALSLHFSQFETCSSSPSSSLRSQRSYSSSSNANLLWRRTHEPLS